MTASGDDRSRTDAEVDARIAQARETMASAGPDAAEPLFKSVVQDHPANFRAWVTVGLFFQHLGRGAEALDAFDRAIRIRPGDATVFTRRALMLLRHHLGPPPPPRARDETKPRVGFSELGRQGRFGNQLLQYAALRLYAERAGAEAEAPDWIGRDLFDLDDPLPGPPLPRLDETEADLLGGPAAPGVDLFGYFCGSWQAARDRRREVCALFRPGARVAPLLDTVEAALRAKGRTVVAVHLRRGDFGHGRFWIAPETWYLDWLQKTWPDLDDPVLYVATDAPALVERFAAYGPVSAADVAVPPPGAEFLPDFHSLRIADIVATSNSSFSAAAAMLNETPRLTVRPDATIGALRPFDHWAEPILLDNRTDT